MSIGLLYQTGGQTLSPGQYAYTSTGPTIGLGSGTFVNGVFIVGNVADGIEIYSGSTAPPRRGITTSPDPNGDMTFWTNSNQTSPIWKFEDGNGDIIRAYINGNNGSAFFQGSISNSNGILIPTSATGYTGSGKMVLSTGTGYSGTCASATTITFVNGIATGCA
ncbi:hypothetical protein ACOBR2_04375 [Telmatobacter bradus]|uniref:hypothetical protein n=1 Tax=Telmatobacter bradus TaxID=474953 RepID=UPI003B43D382